MKTTFFTFIALATLSVGIFLSAQCIAGEENGKPNILIFSSHAFASSAIDMKYKAKLEQAGYTIENALYSDASVTWDKISEANVIILTWVPMSSYTDQVKYFKEKSELFYKFIKAGGGILMLCESDYYQVVPVINEFLSPLGAEILPEQIIDEEHLYRQNSYLQYYFSRTTNVAPHKIADGIKELWYPLGHSLDGGGMKTLTIKANDSAWDVIVKGEESAYSIDSRTKQKTYVSAPPLVAARIYGKGRIVLLPSHSTFWIHAPYHRIWENIVHDKGNGSKFLTNIYDWLGEPSRNNPDVGRPFIPFGSNLVINAGFEDCSVAAVPDKWEGGLSTTGEVVFSIEDKVSHSASHSLRMEAELASTGEYYSAPFTLEEGVLYRLSGWIKSEKLYTEGGSGGYLDGASIALRSAKGTAGWFQQTMRSDRQSIRRTKDWTYVSTIFRWKNKTGKFHAICSYSGFIPATGKVWFDDVSLYKLKRK